MIGLLRLQALRPVLHPASITSVFTWVQKYICYNCHPIACMHHAPLTLLSFVVVTRSRDVQCSCETAMCTVVLILTRKMNGAALTRSTRKHPLDAYSMQFYISGG